MVEEKRGRPPEPNPLDGLRGLARLAVCYALDPDRLPAVRGRRGRPERQPECAAAVRSGVLHPNTTGPGHRILAHHEKRHGLLKKGSAP